MVKMKHYTPIAAPVVAGIDVSKAHLDVYLHPEGKRRRFNNDKTGWRAHRDWLAKAEPEHVVYEATGRYHKGFERYLGGHGLPIARLDPRRAAPDALPRPLACKPKRTWSMPAFWPNSGLS
jgi:transposase